MIKPYPLAWPRNLDFVPLLTLQQTLDPKLDLFYCEAHVSVPLEKISPTGGRRPFRTPLGGIVKSYEMNRLETRVQYGDADPRNYSLSQLEKLPQEEILKDVMANADVPEVVLKMRGVREGIPPEIEDFEALQGCEEILYHQTGRANYTRKIKTSFGLWQLRNPRTMIKNNLILYGIAGLHDPRFRRMRSTLRTDWLISAGRAHYRGYRNLDDVILPIQRALCRGKFWQDTGKVSRLTGRIDSRVINAQVYQLDKTPRYLVSV